MKLTTEQLRQIIREEMVNLVKEESVIREASAGDRMKRYRERLDKLKDKMADTKSPTLKAKYQSTMKNILQRMSDVKKAHGVKSPFKEATKKNINEGVLDNLYTKFNNAVKGAREWAGKKGIQFKVRRPTDYEYDIADKVLTKVDAIGVDTITDNIYAYDGREQYEYILSPEGKVLSKKEGYGI